METVFLNSNNIVANSQNSVLSFNFSSNVTFGKNTKIALKSVDMYYSWFNVSKNYNNNTFQYKWWNSEGILDDIFTVVIPDGNYSIDLINEALQNEMVKNKHYVTDSSSGTNSAVYFLELIANSTMYKFQMNCYYMPSLDEMNNGYKDYVKPVGATWSYPKDPNNTYDVINFPESAPDSGSTPQVIIMNNEFSKLIGFKSGTYPSTLKTTKSSNIGELIPEIDPVSTMLVTCNLVNQKYAYPKNLLYGFSNNATQFGGVISFEVNQYSWCNVSSGVYKNISIQIYDQNYNSLNILDPQMTIALIIDDSEAIYE
jgi:hypothetical protein